MKMDSFLAISSVEKGRTEATIVEAIAGFERWRWPRVGQRSNPKCK